MIQYLWQLPQNLAGGLLLLYFRTIKSIVVEDIYKDVRVCFSFKMRGGISLGKYIFLGETGRHQNKDIQHEYGHCRQSMRLGWLYLPIVGLPSVIHAWLYREEPSDPNGYYRYWTESWADKLGGVSRE
jgi:hypothetical protein